MHISNSRIILILFLGIFILSCSPSVFAYDSDNRDLMKKIQSLEQELMELKSSVYEVKKGQKGLSEAMAAPQKGAMLSSIPIQMYGYIKTDLVYSDSQNPGALDGSALMMNAPSDGSADNDEFTMTSMETRLGFSLDGPQVGEDGVVKGKVETDFWVASGTNILRLRQAFISLNFPKWSLLAGQTWDLFSPLGPSTLNFGYGWRAGNLGDRHPQLILTNKFGKITTKIGAIDTGNASQVDSGGPGVAGLIAYSSGPLYLALGGVYAQLDVTGEDQNIYGGTLAFKLKLTDKVKLMGEGYTGEGLQPFRGCSSTLLSSTGKPVRGTGGWAQLSVNPVSKLAWNIGGGIDDVKTDDSATLGIWDHNLMMFTNLRYQLAKGLSWGLEFQRFVTKYKYADGGDANRYMSSLIYSF